MCINRSRKEEDGREKGC
jgi:Protein kinase domain